MKWHQLSVLALLVLMAAHSPARASAQIVPFIGGGLALGTGDLSDDTDNGWLIIGGLDVPVSSVAPGFAVGVTASYTNIPYGGQFSEATGVTAISAELSYLLGAASSRVRPYVRGGGGLQVHRYDPGIINTNPNTDSRAGFTAGAGVNIGMGSAADAVIGARFASGTDGGFLGFHAGVAVPIGLPR
jgi:hypothetical protein